MKKYSQYNYDEKVVFFTLAIGEYYIEKSLFLIQSVIKFTNSEIYIFTDNISEYDKHRHYYGDRLNVIDISDNDFYIEKINGIFNYHLKCFIFDMMSGLTIWPIIYIDADSFLFGWDNSISRHIHSFENTLIGRFRENVCDNTNLTKFIDEKCKKYEINKNAIDSPMIVENIIILTRGPKSKEFMNQWMEISLEALDKEINPFIEAFEIAIAINKSKINTVNVNNKSPLVDSFRTLHTNNKIISTFVQ